MEYIPGYASLGYGFDVFGRYSDSSKLQPLFNMVFDGQQTFENYLVPMNVNVDPMRHSYGSSTFVDSRQKIEQYFASKLTVQAKYGFFSGQFDASYSMTNKSDVSYQFGIMENFSQLYALDLKDRSVNALADWVKNDPDYQNIPDKFTDDDRALFFRFFDKYGIYYMARIVVGSRMFYSSSIQKEYNYSEVDAEAKLKLEYKAIFMSASAEAQATWKQVGESWASRREVKVDCIGGTNEMLNVLLPGYGANHETAYKNWLASAEAKPAVIDFDLRLVSELFSASKATAVREAIDAYLLHKLFLESKTGSCLIAYNGKSVLPPPSSSGNKVLGYQIAAISRSDLKIGIAKSYSTLELWNTAPLYQQMLNEIQPYNNPNFIIAFVAYSNFAETAPPKFFAEFLENCGAGPQLGQWIDTKVSNAGIYSCCTLAHCNYVFAGIPGSGKGKWHEAFERAGSCDTGGSFLNYHEAWLDKPAPTADLIVDLYQVKTATGDELVANIGLAH